MANFDKIIVQLEKINNIYHVHINLFYLVYFILINLYNKLDEIVLKDNYIYGYEIGQLRNSTKDWFIYLCLYDPDLKVSTSLITSGSVACICGYISFKRRLYKDSKKEKLSLISYLNDISRSDVSISERLENHINDLILSNESTTRRLYWTPFTTKAQLQELNEERAQLISLKSNKNDIWPVQRKGTRWFPLLRHVFLIVYYFNFLCIFSWMLIINIVLLYHYHEKRLAQTLEPLSFLSKKSCFDIYINLMMITDKICLMLTTSISVMFDFVLTLRAQEKYLFKFQNAYHELTSLESQIGPSIWPNWSLRGEQIRLRSNLNRLALEGYIRLRYSFDVSVISTISNLAHIVIISCIFLLITNLHLLAYISPVEYSSMIIYVVLFYFTINVTMLLCAFNYSYCYKIYRRLRDRYTTIIITPLKHTEGSSFIREVRPTTVHTYLVWHKFLSNENDFVEKFTIKLFGLFLLDYKFVLRINLLIGYLIAIHYSSNPK